MDGYLEGKIGDGNEIFLKKDTDACKKIFISRYIILSLDV